MTLLRFPPARTEPDWWYTFLDSLAPAERAFIEREVAPPSEQAPLTPEELQHAKEAVERFQQRERFRR